MIARFAIGDRAQQQPFLSNLVFVTDGVPNHCKELANINR